MKDLLIVDGYNFIFNFFKAGEMTGDLLEEIKLKLINDLISYGSQKDYEIILVFDASKSENSERGRDAYDDVKVIHSMKGETADSVIEELVSTWSHQKNIVVVTSDYSQQKVVFGKNTTRKSSREFGQELESVRRDIARSIKKTKKSSKESFYPIEKRLGHEMRKKITDYRKK